MLRRFLIVLGALALLTSGATVEAQIPKPAKPLREYSYNPKYQHWELTVPKIETPIGVRDVRFDLQNGDERPEPYHDRFVNEVLGWLRDAKAAVRAALPEIDPRFADAKEIDALRGPSVTIEPQEPGEISRWLLHFERDHGKQVIVYTFVFNRKELKDTIVGVH